MPRVLIVLAPIVCSLGLYGGQILPSTSAGCGPGGPTAILTVDGTTFTGFTMLGTPDSCTISGTFFTAAGPVIVRAFTMADPVIDFGMNFFGDSDPDVT